VKIHLIDGTFELFRAYYGAPSSKTADSREVGAVRGLLRSMLSLLAEPETTHVAIAFDHVIESFRNDLYPGYKTSAGIDPDLWAQFGPVEDATRALGLVTWPMVEFETDDALASAAARFADEPRVEQVVICSPDKDLSQCVRGSRVVCLDRLRKTTRNEAGVIAKFGVPPSSIPDWLALVGDSADGYPGIPRWGERSAAAVLGAYGSLENIPEDPSTWSVNVRGAAALAASLRARRGEALLFRRLATLRTDVPLAESLDDLRWRGPNEPLLAAFAERIGDREVLARARRLKPSAITTSPTGSGPLA
jgi:5'-3' exonuclease